MYRFFYRGTNYSVSEEPLGHMDLHVDVDSRWPTPVLILKYRKGNGKSKYLGSSESQSCRKIFLIEDIIIKYDQHENYWQNIQEWNALNNPSFRKVCEMNDVIVPEPVFVNDVFTMVVSERIHGIIKPSSDAWMNLHDNDPDFPAKVEKARRLFDYLQWNDSHGENYGYIPERGKMAILDCGSFYDRHYEARIV